VVCIDGTGNDSELRDPLRNPTNVLRTARAVLPAAPDAAATAQITSYIPGVGTGFEGFPRGPARWTQALFQTAAKIFAIGLSDIVQRAYEFIVNNYCEGDEVFLFGFSRGAFAARSLSGFTEIFGYLEKDRMKDFAEAWNIYQRYVSGQTYRSSNDFLQQRAEAGIAIREASRGAATREAVEEIARSTDFYRRLPLHFLGMWDTVGGLTAGGEGQHQQTLAWNVDVACHALALHEVRKVFEPVLWRYRRPYQKVMQTWFPGAHSDVGGGTGSVALSSAPLAWMLQHAHHDGLQFNADYLVQRDVLAPLSTSPISYPHRDSFEGRAEAKKGLDDRDKVRQNAVCEFRHDTVDERLEAGPVGYRDGDKRRFAGIDHWSVSALEREPVAAAVADVRRARDTVTKAANEYYRASDALRRSRDPLTRRQRKALSDRMTGTRKTAQDAVGEARSAARRARAAALPAAGPNAGSELEACNKADEIVKDAAELSKF